jgi:hypothetical protein
MRVKSNAALPSVKNLGGRASWRAALPQASTQSGSAGASPSRFARLLGSFTASGLQRGTSREPSSRRAATGDENDSPFEGGGAAGAGDVSVSTPPLRQGHPPGLTAFTPFKGGIFRRKTMRTLNLVLTTCLMATFATAQELSWQELVRRPEL